MNYPSIIDSLYSRIKAQENHGDVARYIPELAKVDSNQFGIHMSTTANENYGVGDCVIYS